MSIRPWSKEIKIDDFDKKKKSLPFLLQNKLGISLIRILMIKLGIVSIAKRNTLRSVKVIIIKCIYWWLHAFGYWSIKEMEAKICIPK
jgi:hypothetical protein